MSRFQSHSLFLENVILSSPVEGPEEGHIPSHRAVWPLALAGCDVALLRTWWGEETTLPHGFGPVWPVSF